MPLHLPAHPLEWLNKLQRFFYETKKDLDYRYPDTRKRLLSELEIDKERLATETHERIRQQLTNTKDSYSFLDWNLLAYWRETTEFAKNIIELKKALEIQGSPQILPAIYERLKELLEQALETPPPDSPNWIPLIEYRWSKCIEREESRYLLERLEKTLKLDKAS